MIFLYFDPGIGAMIIQVIIAAVAGLVLFSKNVVYKVKLFLGLTKKKDDIFNDIDLKSSKVENKEKIED